MKRYGLYNHPQARIIGEMVEVEFGTWVRYEDVAAIEAKYSEAVELIKEMEQWVKAFDETTFDFEMKDKGIEMYESGFCDRIKNLLKRHKGDV